MALSEDQVNMAKAIVDQMKDTPVMNLPINNEHERRAICIKFAIEMKTFSIRNDDPKAVEAAQLVVASARIFEEYITNG